MTSHTLLSRSATAALCLGLACALLALAACGEKKKAVLVGEVNMVNGQVSAAPDAYTALLGHAPTGVAQAIVSQRTIKIAVSPNDPPRSSLDKSGQPRGFDVEVARTAASVLGLQVDWVPASPRDLQTGLQAGRYDLAVESIAVPATPVDGLAFTTPYAFRPVQLFTSVGGPQVAGAQDIDGHKVGALAGTQAAAYLKQATMARVKLFQSADKMYPQLVNGNLEFLALDSGVAVKAINKGVPMTLSGKPIAFEDLAFVGKGGESDLVALFDYALKKMHERVNGQDSPLSILSKKWFNGVDLTVKP